MLPSGSMEYASGAPRPSISPRNRIFPTNATGNTLVAAAVGVAVKSLNAKTIGVGVRVGGPLLKGRGAVGVAVIKRLVSGVPVVKAMAVASSANAVAVALLAGVGVLVTTMGRGVKVAVTAFIGSGVAVPVLSASAVMRAATVAATSTFSGVKVAVTTNCVAVAVGEGCGVGVADGRGAVVGVLVRVGGNVGSSVLVGRGVAVQKRIPAGGSPVVMARAVASMARYSAVA